MSWTIKIKEKEIKRSLNDEITFKIREKIKHKRWYKSQSLACWYSYKNKR